MQAAGGAAAGELGQQHELLLAGSRVGFAQGESCQLCPFENEQQRGKEKKREREVGGAQGGSGGGKGRENRWGLFKQKA